MDFVNGFRMTSHPSSMENIWENNIAMFQTSPNHQAESDGHAIHPALAKASQWCQARPRLALEDLETLVDLATEATELTIHSGPGPSGVLGDTGWTPGYPLNSNSGNLWQSMVICYDHFRPAMPRALSDYWRWFSENNKHLEKCWKHTTRWGRRTAAICGELRRCERLFQTDSEVKPAEVTVNVWFLQTVDASNIRDFRKMLQDLPKFHESPI